MSVAGTPPAVESRPSADHALQTLRDGSAVRTQHSLAMTGALLMPLGIVVITLGWTITRHVPVTEQSGTLLWAGFGGLAVTVVGVSLYVGSWLAQIAIDSREATRHLAATSLVLADAIARAPLGGQHGLDVDALRVTAGGGVTVHRRGCPLIEHRDDLSLVGRKQPHQNECRVCRPGRPPESSQESAAMASSGLLRSTLEM